MSELPPFPPQPHFEACMVAIDFALHARMRVSEQNAKCTTKAGTAEERAWDRVLDVLRKAAMTAPKLRAEVEAAEVRGARWALDAAERAVHVEAPALDPAEICRARRGR